MLLVVPVPVVVVSLFCAHAPRLNALTAIATTITALKIFIKLIRLLSEQVARRHLGRSVLWRNDFLALFMARPAAVSAAITTGVSTSTRSNNSATSAFLIRMHP